MKKKGVPLGPCAGFWMMLCGSGELWTSCPVLAGMATGLMDNGLGLEMIGDWVWAMGG